MNNILKSISFIFHPLLIPLLGVVFYFAKSPKYISLQIIQAKLISLFIFKLFIIKIIKIHLKFIEYNFTKNTY